MKTFTPINFKKWIDEHRSQLKPPVGNQQVWEDREFMVTVVGGPNQRSDYHINEGEEFFYQLEGDVVLRILQDNVRQDIHLREGDIFLLPPRVPHSPQRAANTVGLVLERKRLPHEKDGFVWYCSRCGEKLYEEFVHLTHIVKQMPEIFDRFYKTETNCVCKKCGTRAEKN